MKRNLNYTLFSLCLTLVCLMVPGLTLQAQNGNEKGFKSLFNGKNLDGWPGNKDSYIAEDGMIVINPEGGGSGGNLFTENQSFNFGRVAQMLFSRRPNP